MIRVLIVDDSPFVCRLLSGHLGSADDIQVIATAHDGKRALAKIADFNPDVITLAQSMSGLNGVETLERIMHECPTPVVMISGISRKSAIVTRRALQMGAVDFVLKYTPGTDTHPDELRHEIVSKVRAAAQVK
ncbi:MAG: response regulator, partial [Candidatus Promineifilaceae bacterium]